MTVFSQQNIEGACLFPCLFHKTFLCLIPLLFPLGLMQVSTVTWKSCVEDNRIKLMKEKGFPESLPIRNYLPDTRDN
jgi:hypothetical protein